MSQQEREEEERRKAREREMIFQAASRSKAGPVVKAPVTRDAPKVGRNDPCSCGSGKKFKKCHGVNAVH
jgi:preprotein translocase subunit SecA